MLKEKGWKFMNKNNCIRLKNLLEDIYKEKHIKIKIVIIDKESKGNGFWKMRIKLLDKKYNHLLNHIYNTCYSVCTLTGEYLDKEKIKRGFLYLS